ncbi:hypothetical protein GCM10010872_40660 [Dyella flava]|nr:hypothetical protein GCM10010872_40660 [Dyella flava]
MPPWVPILGGDGLLEQAAAEQAVDAWHDRVAFMAGQGAARHEIRLHIDKDQGGMILHGKHS